VRGGAPPHYDYNPNWSRQHGPTYHRSTVPVLTPFKADLSPDTERFVRQCKWLIANNVGLAVFGTNSEANSLAAGERMELLEKLVKPASIRRA